MMFGFVTTAAFPEADDTDRGLASSSPILLRLSNAWRFLLSIVRLN